LCYMKKQREGEKQQKQITPPYLSISKLEKSIELISNRSFNEIAVVLFTANGFSNVDALLAISALKFLGLVNDNGIPTELMSKLRLKGDIRKKEFEGIIRAAYRKLFETIDTPQNLSSDDLFNAFHAHYSNLSDRVIRAAIPVFLKLCEFAGLREEGSVVARKRRLNNGLAKKSSNRVQNQLENGFAAVRVAEGRIVLNIPPELKDRLFEDETLVEDWSILRKALTVFADKYIPKEEQKKKEVSSSIKENV
jgi:hypothetical protein